MSRIARIEWNGHVHYCTVEQEHFRPLEGDPFTTWKETDQRIPRTEAKLLSPVQPCQILAIGLNYKEHAKESGSPVPDAPLLFVKATSALNGPEESILLPSMAPNEVDYEAELVIVIGQKVKNISPKEAPTAILGYTCGNDVSARDCQLRLDKQWARGKSFDTFAPIGPWIETDLDPSNLDVRSLLNGKVMQQGSTSDMIFDCAELVSYLSRCMTLFPGSIIMTGTPPGVGFARKPPVFLREGDVIEVEIQGIGTLRNPVLLDRP